MPYACRMRTTTLALAAAVVALGVLGALEAVTQRQAEQRAACGVATGDMVLKFHAEAARRLEANAGEIAALKRDVTAANRSDRRRVNENEGELAAVGHDTAAMNRSELERALAGLGRDVRVLGQTFAALNRRSAQLHDEAVALGRTMSGVQAALATRLGRIEQRLRRSPPPHAAGDQARFLATVTLQPLCAGDGRRRANATVLRC